MPNPTANLDPTLRLAARVSLGAATGLTLFWLWCCWCGFPAIPWNDIRVAPAIALHQGLSAYSTATAGPITTWTYGPVPILLMWPAGLAATAAGALQAAGAIHIGIMVGVLVWVCFAWPVQPGANLDPGRRFMAALLCVLLVRNPTSGYVVFCADSPGVALGLLSLLALARGHRWAAAAMAATAAACKQTMVDIALAECLWLYVAVAPKEAAYHALRCMAAGLFVAIACIPLFGAAELWYSLVELPRRFPSVPPWPRLGDHLPYLAGHVLLPGLVLAAGRRRIFRRESPFLLPALAFCCTLPLGFAGLFTVGGNVNSLHSFWLWFPPTLLLFLGAAPAAWFGVKTRLGVALLLAALATGWIQSSGLPARPNLRVYRDAAELTRLMPGRVWFPLHPVVTLYSDRRLYHDLDGLTVRKIVGEPVSDEHFRSFMPLRRQVCAMLLPVGWAVTDIRLARLPAGSTTRVFGVFQLDGVFNGTEPNR